jgi:hypothetical protein
MTTRENEGERGFKVIDRRGNTAGEAAPSAAPPPSAGAKPPAEPERPAAESLPAVDFASFVLSLATSALYHMGLVGDPERDEQAPEPDLPLARQTIDSLEMLQHKTRGNLDAEEARLIEGVLYELRLRFVEVRK